MISNFLKYGKNIPKLCKIIGNDLSELKFFIKLEEFRHCYGGTSFNKFRDNTHRGIRIE